MTWIDGEVEYYPLDKEVWNKERLEETGGREIIFLWVEALTPGVKPPYMPVIQLVCQKCGDWCWGGKFTFSIIKLAAGRTMFWCRACFLRHLGPDEMIGARNPDDPDFDWEAHGNVHPSDPRFDWDFWDIPADLRRWDDWDPEK